MNRTKICGLSFCLRVPCPKRAVFDRFRALSLRPSVLGQKSWLFTWFLASVPQSLCPSCKMSRKCGKTFVRLKTKACPYDSVFLVKIKFFLIDWILHLSVPLSLAKKVDFSQNFPPLSLHLSVPHTKWLRTVEKPLNFAKINAMSLCPCVPCPNNLTDLELVPPSLRPSAPGQKS